MKEVIQNLFVQAKMVAISNTINPSIFLNENERVLTLFHLCPGDFISDETITLSKWRNDETHVKELDFQTLCDTLIPHFSRQTYHMYTPWYIKW